MGYHELGGGKNFKIHFSRQNDRDGCKQIDVFARDDETVIVVECKASEKSKKRSLHKDIADFSNLKGHIANTLKQHYGRSFKPKILWFFVPHNILWSQPVVIRVHGENIPIINERGLRLSIKITEQLCTA